MVELGGVVVRVVSGVERGDEDERLDGLEAPAELWLGPDSVEHLPAAGVGAGQPTEGHEGRGVEDAHDAEHGGVGEGGEGSEHAQRQHEEGGKRDQQIVALSKEATHLQRPARSNRSGRPECEGEGRARQQFSSEEVRGEPREGATPSMQQPRRERGRP